MKLSVTQYAKLVDQTRSAVLWQISEGKLIKGVSSTKIGNNHILSVSKRAEKLIEEMKEMKIIKQKSKAA